MLVNVMQRFLPASVKNALKPWYRTIFPNQLIVLIWPTFRCNYKCSYCPVMTQFNMASVYPGTSERTPEDWNSALGRLPKASIYFSGGEPFLYRQLPELINGLKRHSVLGIVTNATVAVPDYDRIERHVHLNVSFHREFVTEEKFLAKLKALQALGKFHLNVNIVATRANIPVLQSVAALTTIGGVSLHVDPFIDPQASFQYSKEEIEILQRFLDADRLTNLDRIEFNDYREKRCSAGRNYINVMPDGTVFRCAQGFEYFHNPAKESLLRGSEDPAFFRTGNIFDPAFRLESADVSCSAPCLAACDRDMATIQIN